MLLMLDTSHSPIALYGPVGHSPVGDSLRHASTARFSSALDCGENAAVGQGGVGVGWEGRGGTGRGRGGAGTAH